MSALEQAFQETKTHLQSIATELTAYRVLGTVDELMKIIEFANQATQMLDRETLQKIILKANERLLEIDTEVYLNKQMGDEWTSQTFPME